jgi:hypothetical protein
MNAPDRAKQNFSEDASPAPVCQAQFIFFAKTREKETPPVKILGEYVCDFRRPDWEQRWKDWNLGRNPFLNLFLCEDHARKLGLLDEHS